MATERGSFRVRSIVNAKASEQIDFSKFSCRNSNSACIEISIKLILYLHIAVPVLRRFLRKSCYLSNNCKRQEMRGHFDLFGSSSVNTSAAMRFFSVLMMLPLTWLLMLRYHSS